MKNHSWIIVHISSNTPVLEVFSESILSFVNLNKYKVFTAHDWLVYFNNSIKQQSNNY